MADDPRPDESPERPTNEQSVFPDRYQRHMERAQHHAERARARAERRAQRWGGGAWVGGAILIALGMVFLAQNLGLATLDNWWALFILIPAVGSLGTAWNIYQHNDGQLTPAARGSLITGLVLVAIAAAFLFNLNLGLLWPLLLILAGLAALLNAVL